MNIFSQKTISITIIAASAILSACSGDSSQSSDESSSDLSLARDTPVAYVERGVDQASESNNERFDQARMNDGQTPLELYSPYIFSPGAKLYERSGIDVDAVNTEILSAYFQSSVYDVKDLNVSPDGSKLIFAAHGPIDHPTDYTWNIYEYSFETKVVRRIIEDNALANVGQDTNPTYALSGDIVFSSDRSAGNPESPIENVVPDPEYCYKITPKEKPSLLHSMTDQGENILQLTYGINHDTNPTTLKDGRIAFIRTSFTYELLAEDVGNPPANRASRDELLSAEDPAPWGLRRPQSWSEQKLAEYSEATPVGRVIASNNYTLLRITADGQEIEQLYDTVSVASSDEEFIFIDRIVQAENGRLVAVLKHKFNEALGGDILEFRSPDESSEDLVFGNVAPSSLVEGSSGLYPNQLPQGGWYSALWPYRDGSGRLLVSWSQCLTNDDGVNSFCNNEVAENGEDSQYGIWVYDVDGKTRLPVVRAKRDTLYEDVTLSRSHSGLEYPYEAFNPNYIDNLDGSQIICNYPEPVNTAPIANAGADQSVYSNSVVTLDGSASSDPDSDVITYNWSIASQPAGSSATLDDSSAVTPSFTADQVGNYVFQLVVNDTELDSPADTVTIVSALEVVNQAPVANAGVDQQALVGNVVTLDAMGSSDPDGDALSYQWSVIAPAGINNSILSSTTSTSPSFDADIAGTYTLQLVVSDGQLTSAPDTVSVVVNYPNRAPIAEAGNSQQVSIGSTVVLNGSGSSDPDGDPITYQWSVVGSSSGAALSNATNAMPSITLSEYGTFVVQLVVNDGSLSSTPDTVTLSVVNSQPVANAGEDLNVQLSQLTTLDGSSSYDPDGSSLTYNWVLSSAPDGNTASLTSPNSVSPTISPDVEGTYTAQLIVNDGVLDSVADTVSINVTYDANTAPVADAGDDQKVSIGGTFTLDGSRSSDADGDAITYSWNVISPAGVALSNPNAVRPTINVSEFGDYIIELVVNDGVLDSEPDTVNLEFDNVTSVADAGPDQTVPVGTTVILDGSGSTDVNGDPLTYSWTITDQPDSSTATLTNSDSVSPQLITDQPGDFTIELIVNDGTVNSAPDSVVVTSTNTKPVADAGPDMLVAIGSDASLNGGDSYDADGDTISYEWNLINAPAGSTATLLNATSVDPTLQGVDVYGDYVVQLVVNDGLADSNPDTVILSSQNLAPIAKAGLDIHVETGVLLSLDGSLSYDPQGEAITYSWSLISAPSGSSTTLSNTTSVTPSLTPDEDGIYVVQLIVNDGLLNSAPDTMRITSKTFIGPEEVTHSCENLPRQSATISLDFPSTNTTYPEGSEGLCEWSYTANRGDDYIQGLNRQSVIAELPANAIVCSSALSTDSGEATWNYDDEFFLTLGDEVLASSEKASIMEGMADLDNYIAYGEGTYNFDFLSILDMPNTHSDEKYCLGHPRVGESDDNPMCTFPKTQLTGPFNIAVPEAAFAAVSADIVNQGQAEFAMIVTGDNDNLIDCQHTGIELNWNVEYVVPPVE
ncbi:MAG: PKD domain-containing protein [Cellvibrionaceae bacterium]